MNSYVEICPVCSSRRYGRYIGCDRLRSVKQVVTYALCGVCKKEGRHLDR
jgi:hypothetical protein